MCPLLPPQVCRSFGFYKRTCPLVFTIEGDLIGDQVDFREHVRSRYCRTNITMAKEFHDVRYKDNMQQAEDVIRNRLNGPSLREKIAKKSEKAKKLGLISHIVD